MIDGETALGVAALKGHVDIVKELILQGAQVNLGTDTTAGLPLYEVCRGRLYDESDVLDLLSFDQSDSATSVAGDLVVTQTRQHLELEVAKLLIAAGATINKVEVKPGDTPLSAAIKHKKEHLVSLLLEKGANPNLRRILHAVYPLVWALGVDTPLSMTRMLLAHGAKLEKKHRKAAIKDLYSICENHRHVGLMRIALMHWPLHANDVTLDIIKFPFMQKVQRQLSREHAAVAMIDSDLRRNPSSFFSVIPRDIFEYMIKPMALDTSCEASYSVGRPL